ncbi:hypothetical protein V9L05_02025 [Bernardetia sp. Wsw4-3y2]|uniref:hypothetical protein n=1 Tax=Bernardetia sp. Wsw4-3y2 TaxID=3127471 RepID=UPI0030D1EBFC
MNSITSKTFETLCFEKDETVEIYNVEIKGNLRPYHSCIESNIIIAACIFTDYVKFENITCNSNCSIRFVDCTFKKSVHIKSWKSNIIIQGEWDSNNYSIKFENTKFEGVLSLESLNLHKGIHITKKTSIYKLNCIKLSLKNGEFLIDESTVNLAFDLTTLKASNLNIKNESIINAQTHFTDIRANISLNDSEFNGHTFLSGCKTKTLYINSNIFNKKLLISNPLISEMYISETEFKKEVGCLLQVSNHFLKKVEISDSKFSNKFILTGGRSIIEKLIIKFSKELKGIFEFNSCRINNVILTGKNYNTNINFEHTEFQSLLFNKFSNYADISFNSSKPLDSESDLIIRGSNLGKTHFFNFSFNDFKNIVIDNSVLIDIITVNVK